MKRITAIFLAALAIGCGMEANEPDQKAPPSAPPDAGVPGGAPVYFAAFVDPSVLTTVKVVVKSAGTVEQLVYVGDDEETEAPVPCTSDTECTLYDARCSGDSSLCVWDVENNSPFYVHNYAVSNGTVSFPIPCDGSAYVAEIFAAGAGYAIQETYKSNEIVVSQPSCAAPASPWPNPAQPVGAPPTLAIPKIYANIPFPYDTYRVSAIGIAYPWTGGFSITANGVAGSVSGATATFASPTTSATINFAARFGLDRSLLQAGDGTWHFPVSGSAAPIGAAMITGP